MFAKIKSQYYSDDCEDIAARLEECMKYESDAILRLIFDRYDEAVLLLYRSAGSNLENYYDMLVQSKIKESVAFFQKFGYVGVSEEMLGFLISVQFDSYRRIIVSCSDRNAAEKYINLLMTYHFGGWSALFDSENNTQEGMCDEI